MSSKSRLSSDTCVPFTRLYLGYSTSKKCLHRGNENHVRRHDSPRIGILNRYLERLEVYLSECPLADFTYKKCKRRAHRSQVAELTTDRKPLKLLVIRHEMFDSRADTLRLEAIDIRCSNPPIEMRIFRKGLESTSTERRSLCVNSRRE